MGTILIWSLMHFAQAAIGQQVTTTKRIIAGLGDAANQGGPHVASMGRH